MLHEKVALEMCRVRLHRQSNPLRTRDRLKYPYDPRIQRRLAPHDVDELPSGEEPLVPIIFAPTTLRQDDRRLRIVSAEDRKAGDCLFINWLRGEQADSGRRDIPRKAIEVFARITQRYAHRKHQAFSMGTSIFEAIEVGTGLAQAVNDSFDLRIDRNVG